MDFHGVTEYERNRPELPDRRRPTPPDERVSFQDGVEPPWTERYRADRKMEGMTQVTVSSVLFRILSRRGHHERLAIS